MCASLPVCGDDYSFTAWPNSIVGKSSRVVKENEGKPEEKPVWRDLLSFQRRHGIAGPYGSALPESSARPGRTMADGTAWAPSPVSAAAEGRRLYAVVKLCLLMARVSQATCLRNRHCTPPSLRRDRQHCGEIPSGCQGTCGRNEEKKALPGGGGCGLAAQLPLAARVRQLDAVPGWCQSGPMRETAKKLLDAFDSLPEADRHEDQE